MYCRNYYRPDQYVPKSMMEKRALPYIQGELLRLHTNNAQMLADESELEFLKVARVANLSKWCASSNNSIIWHITVSICASRCVSSCLNLAFCSTVQHVRKSLKKERSSSGFVPKESSSTRLKMAADPPLRISTGGRQQRSHLMWEEWWFYHCLKFKSSCCQNKNVVRFFFCVL